MPKQNINILKYLTLLLAAGLFVFQLYHVFNSPIWRDDAYFGTVAKNILTGDGYKATYFDKTYIFHRDISTGPAFLFPAAFFIAKFGNTYWIMGLIQILYIWGLLTSIFFTAKSFLPSNKIWPFALFSLTFLLLFTVDALDNYGIETGERLGLWHLMMGDIPAGLTVILGALILFSSSNSKAKIISGGMILGLSFLVKEIVGISLAVIGLGLIVKFLIIDKPISKKSFLRLIIAYICMALPAVIFEISKLLTLGLAGYIKIRESVNEAYKEYGLHATGNGVVPHLNALSEYYFFALLILIFSLIFLAIRTKLTDNNSKHIRLAGITLIVSFLMHFTWWMAFSIPFMRYMVVAYIFCVFGIALLLSVTRFKRSISRAVFILCLLIVVYTPLKSLVGYVSTTGFTRNPRIDEQTLIHKTLLDLRAKNINLIACGNNYEQEFLIPEIGNFRDCHDFENSPLPQPTMLISYFITPQHDLIYTTAKDLLTLNDAKIPDYISKRCNVTFLQTENYLIQECDDKLNAISPFGEGFGHN